MSLPSDYSNEISALDREVKKQQPKDVLQFCANFFQRRLESQRAEFQLSQRHSSQPGMPPSNFPGTNPFGATAAAAGGAGAAAAGVGMASVAEEEEHDVASPTTAGSNNFPPPRDNSANMNSTSNSIPLGISVSARSQRVHARVHRRPCRQEQWTTSPQTTT